MSDSLWYLVCPEKAPPDVVARMKRVLTQLAAGGFTGEEVGAEAVLGTARGPVYRPGPAAIDAAQAYEDISDLLTNGIEFCIEPIFNDRVLGEGILRCGKCGVTFDPEQDEAFEDQLDAVGYAAADFDFSDRAVECLKCGQPTAVNDWAPEGEFLIAGYGLALWNWPAVPALRQPLMAALETARGDQSIAENQVHI